MELRVKQKMINGKKVMGIINENLKEISPFEFANIVEVKEYGYNGYKYFICEKEDGTCSLYDKNGCCRISINEGYKELKVLKFSFGNDWLNVVAKKDDKVGILRAGFEWDRGEYSSGRPKVEVAYPFGKCDEIRELADKTVQLIKHTNSGNRIGYWHHENINELVEPKFLSYDYYTIDCKQGVGLPTYKDENGDEKCFGHSRLSNSIEYDKLTLNVEIIGYSKLKDKKKVIGLKQRVYDSSKETYHPSFKFEDFIPAIYSNISYDEEKQIFFLEQKINGQIKKGFKGVTFDWHLMGRGSWVWGYPNLKTAVDVPCEYDDIKIIEDNYALVKKNGKYGIIDFSFGKSNGDWWCGRTKRYADGKCREMVPCQYDEIVKAKGNYFIGQINNEQQIITDCIDSETKQTVIIDNNYNEVKQISEKVFLCDLGNGKKEIVIIKENGRYYVWEDKLCSISKIYPCDNVEIIGDSCNNNLIKILNDNIIDVYLDNGKKMEENIADIIYDSRNYFYIITKNDGHIKYVRSSGDVVFTTEGLVIEPNNLSVVYLEGIDKFKVTNNNLIRIHSRLNVNNGNNIYDNDSRLFGYFDCLTTRHYTFVGYTEVLENCLVTKLCRINIIGDKMQETEILSGNFQVENIVLDGKRIIFSTIDFENGQKKYGVIESQEGNICIDCAYNNIQYDSNNQVFICSSDDEKLVFDTDGFINENQDVKGMSSNQKVLKITLQNNS